MNCPACNAPVLDIDVKCPACGKALTSTGSQRILGTVVLGQYKLTDVLGQGGMSVVYKGEHAMTGQEVALKLLPPELAAHAQVKGRFLEEARALASLDHPNIVHLYNFGQENGAFVLAMQFVRGKTWERLIMDQQRLGWAESTRIAIDVLRALEYAHGRGVVHRDMKPSNVLVREVDGAATVMDFGIAKMTTSSRLTETGQTMGTVRYMSPEQVRGMEVTGATDIYSLGATLYESLVGDTPFDGDTHFDIMSKHLTETPAPPGSRVELPAALDEAVMRSLRKKPDERFASAREFRKALEHVLTSTAHDADAIGSRRLARESVMPEILASLPRAAADPVTARGPAVESPPGPGQRAATAVSTEPSRDVGAPARRGRGLWIGLAVALAAAAIVVGVVISTRTDPGAADAGSGSASPTTAAIRPYAPPGITLVPAAPLAERGVQALGPDVTRAKAVAAEVAIAIAAFNGQAAQRGAERPFAPDLLFVAVVPRQVLCAPATYAERLSDGTMNLGEPPPACEQTSAYYRLTDRTLLVPDDPSTLKANLRVGLSEVVSLHRPDLSGAASAFASAVD
jgi:serine/threonine protein kinase